MQIPNMFPIDEFLKYFEYVIFLISVRAVWIMDHFRFIV